MKRASLTNHAKQRIDERCGLSFEEIRQLLDAEASIAIHLQKGGRYAHRLLYSHPDKGWFMVVQDGGDGGVLTVMPLEYLEWRGEVTAAQKRQARSRADEVRRAAKRAAASPPEKVPEAKAGLISALPGWKIRVRYVVEGETIFKHLPRTPAEHGDPTNWLEPGLIQIWFKERLIEAGIPFGRIVGVMAGRKGNLEQAEQLLEHLPLTEDELQSCR